MKITRRQTVFCSYACTGEDVAEVEARMELVLETFRMLGVNTYCILHDEQTAKFTTPDQYMQVAFEEVQKSDILFVIKASERRSEGQMMEVGAALMRGMPMILAQHTSSVGKTYLDTLAKQSFTWTTNKQLQDGIRTLV